MAFEPSDANSLELNDVAVDLPSAPSRRGSRDVTSLVIDESLWLSREAESRPVREAGVCTDRDNPEIEEAADCSPLM